jgi:hypothetical protein
MANPLIRNLEQFGALSHAEGGAASRDWDGP